ncbi:DUF5710 domain-containing protein [Pseudomonas sp. SBB6]|uniref:DUF5710 domain-containing protein n=1 Tax=Pseudomonas sp. SBB6 TaxID=2962032 RepID=UPI0020B7E741|nr:DUF5710 domain-containing protein [Pseudomonas sp. SBB6]MCP3751873.1 DUF5710 domain-containing protein [Pseudomonas sp. SBB6]
MTRADLNVPFAEKDEAKALGARWDPQLKTWYVPEGKEIGLFVRWLPSPPEPALEHLSEYQIRSPYYYIAESLSDCWKCSNWGRVFAFLLPPEHEEFEVVEDEDEAFALTCHQGYWACHGYYAKVSQLASVSPDVLEQLRLRTQQYKPARSKTAGCIYYMNHCEHCGAKLGDFFMHSEPGGAFFPTCPEEAERIQLRRVNGAFRGNGSLGFSTPDFVEYMQLIG